MKNNKCLAALTLGLGLLSGAAYADAWPTGTADNVTVNKEQRVYIPVLANDLGSGLSLVEINTTTVALGSVEMNASKTALYYKSANGFTGDDSFWYAFKDNQGRTNATQVFVKVISFGGGGEEEVTPPNDDYSGWPAANVDNATTPMNTSITVPVLDNDIGDRLSLTEVNSWTVKAGRASIQGDSILYTPHVGFTGEDSFWYNFEDARGRKNSTQVKVSVTNGNDDGGGTEGISDAVHIPMYFDFLKSQRFVWGESGGTQSTTVTRAASAGSSQLTVSNGSSFVDGQLISYLSTDGQYYTVAVSSVQSNTVNLRTSLPAPIARWGNVWNFYNDGSHPNDMGFRSLADFALRNNDVSALNSGKHVMLGDSWFASGALYQRLTEKLGNANFINLGVGGNTSAMLLERFDAQVGNQNPDVVWIIAGTNDYYQGVSVNTFKSNMAQLIAKINALGAKAMVFDNSIAPLMSGSDALTEKSKQYAQAIADLINQ